MRQRCKECGEVKRMGDFYRHPHYATGHMKTCKRCHCRNVRENRALKVEHYLAYNRDRAMLPHHVAQRKAYAQTPKGRDVKRRANRYYMRWIRLMAREGGTGWG